MQAPSIGFGQAISLAFSNYFNFTGRARRPEFWYFVLFQVLAGFGLGILEYAFMPQYGDNAGPLIILFNLATFIPTLSLAARRLHDVNKSGWWIAAPIAVALIGVFLLSTAATLAQYQTYSMVLGLAIIISIVLPFVWTFLDGTVGPNRFGPDPKNRLPYEYATPPAPAAQA
jgi:uncharacterized membrane protein YhaH (DUF805 family)